jgi:hypothetical protein
MNKEALKLVLEALKVSEHFVEEYAASKYYYAHVVAIAAAEEALAQAQRTWVGLTYEEKYALADDVAWRGVPVFEAICEAEAKLKEKNT